MATNGNTMPHSVDAEEALLGCLLIDNDLQSEIVEGLVEEDFYLEAHRYIIKAMRRVFADKKPVDLVTLSDELEHSGELERAGGIAYLTEMAQSTPSTANYRHYYDIVKRDSTNRKLIRAARRIADNSMKGEESRVALEFAEKQIYDLSRQEENSALKDMAEGNIVGEVIRKFEDIERNPDSLRGVETGFRQLDKITNGLQKSDLIVLAARPGMGKTSFAMNIVENAALQKNKICAVFSLEMPRIQIVQRLLCAYAEVSMEKALSGKLEQREWKKLLLASDRLTKSRIYIDDTSRIMPAEILSKCRRLSAQAGGLDLVMIDYIQLMGGSSGSKGGENNRQLEVAAISRDLKLMAKELDVPVIALSQLHRIQTKEPQLSDLRDSGAIEQDADIVMFINRPEATATEEELASGKIVKGAADLIIAKHRNGSQGRIQLKFRGECTKFVDIDAQNRDDEPPMPVMNPADYDAPIPEEESAFSDPPPEPPAPRAMQKAMSDDEELPF